MKYIKTYTFCYLKNINLWYAFLADLEIIVVTINNKDK